jgi:hypothetical protein
MAEPDGGNLLVRIWGGARSGNRRAYSTRKPSRLGSQIFLVRTQIARAFNTDPGGPRRRASLYL